MKLALFATFGSGIFFVASLCAQRIHPSLLWLPFMAASGLALIVECAIFGLMGILRWRKATRWWPTPTLLSLFFIVTTPLSLRAGGWMRNQLFQHRLPAYQSIVEGVRTGRIPCGPEFADLKNEPMPPGVKRVWALRKPGGGILVMFFTVEGFPVHHEGYLFEDCRGDTGCDSALKALNAEMDLQPVAANWCYFMD